MNNIMSTQTSQLVSNLQNIYNEKLLIKSAIGTNSDNFLEYHTLIQNAISEGGGGSGEGNDMNPFYAEYVDGPIISAGTHVVEGTNGNLMIKSDLEFYYEGDPVTEDGHTIDTIEFNTILYDPDDDSITYPAHVILTGEGGVESIQTLLDLWVDNEDYQEDLYGITITVKSWTATESEDPSEDGYDYLIECQGLNYINAMENNSNVEEITENGFFINDTCAIGFNVNVSGGSGSVKADPLYGGVYIQDMIENEEKTADYFKTVISDNFSATAIEVGGEPTGEYENISWYENAEFEENGETVEKIVYVVITGDPHGLSGNASVILNAGQDYPQIYGNIFPILEDVTLTISEDPSNDGYDYLIEGNLYAWNLCDCCAAVDEISQNDFLLNNGQVGFNVNVQ